MIKGFKILDSNDVRESLFKYREKGALRGKYIGFPYLDEFYTMSLPGCTDFTGFPQSGKSEFLLEILLNMSLYYGWKHLFWVPDIGSKEEIVAILIHKVSGKTFDKRFPNLITEAEIDRHLEWVLHHFRIVIKEDLKAKMTPHQFWDLAAEMNHTVDGGIQTSTIDSWKDMYHDMAGYGRDDKYLEDALSYRNAMAEAHNQHHNIVIHPIKTETDKNGMRKPPTPYDLKGGSEWYNNGKCMITVHRVSGEPNAVDIMITKAKPKSVASIGTARMYFDMSIAKFYWLDGNEKVYANKEKISPKALEIANQSTLDLDEPDDLPF